MCFGLLSSDYDYKETSHSTMVVKKKNAYFAQVLLLYVGYNQFYCSQRCFLAWYYIFLPCYENETGQQWQHESMAGNAETANCSWEFLCRFAKGENLQLEWHFKFRRPFVLNVLFNKHWDHWKCIPIFPPALSSITADCFCPWPSKCVIEKNVS